MSNPKGRLLDACTKSPGVMARPCLTSIADYRFEAWPRHHRRNREGNIPGRRFGTLANPCGLGKTAHAKGEAWDYIPITR